MLSNSKKLFYSCNKKVKIETIYNVAMGTIITITKSRIVLFHNTRSKDARFMPKLCLSLHAINRLMREEAVYISFSSTTSLDNSNRVLFLSLKAKSG